ncbi:glucosamine inositolphosphorylceramide transferase family protein [Peijinzhouia sedimentorum]
MVKLKVGLLLNEEKIPAWSWEMIRQIQESSFAEISLLILREDTKSEPNDFNKFIYRAYRKLDRKFFPANPDAFARKAIAPLLPANITKVYVTPRQSKFSDYFPESKLEEIKSHQPDVLLRMGFRILRGDILNLPKYGIWSFHHGDNQVNKGGPPAFWEVMLGWHCTGTVLQILTENLDDGKVLFRSWSQTDPLSVNRNAQKVYWKSLSFVPRLLEKVAHQGQKAIDTAIAKQQSQIPPSKGLFKPPHNLQMIGLLARLLAKSLSRKIKEAFSNKQWFLLVKDAADENTPPIEYKSIIPPKDRFYADPFPISVNGKIYVFFEELMFNTKKGHIAVGEWENGDLLNIRPALKEDYHLSYPFVFKDAGEWYMLPESRANRSIDLYKAFDFPNRWEKQTILMNDIAAVDATLVKRDGLWWMFVNIAENKGSSAFDELFLFSTPSLTKPDWRSHPCNPIVSDVRNARMAGKLFLKDGEWIRPAQDCSVRYGYAIHFNKITKWSLEEYDEERIGEILPDWDKHLLGTHTFNMNEQIAVLDAYKSV